LVSGEIALIEDENDSKNDYTIEITELPIGVCSNKNEATFVY
jgi:hypothetical protein